jgi:DTW domain-containing protein YfiP
MGSGAPHAVARLREARLARRDKPFVARGSRAPRCPGCRVIFSHCLCALRPQVPTRAGMCLIMCDIEPLKPSNTGWLIADAVTDTVAFGWSRTEVDPALPVLLADSQWTPYLVFPGEFVEASRVVTEVAQVAGKRPLFVLLDATWPEARKMFRKSPYLDHLPVLSLQPEQLSRYRLRRSTREDHLCTSEVAALCLALAGEAHAGETLTTYLEVFSSHYLSAKQSIPPDWEDAAHQRLRALAGAVPVVEFKVNLEQTEVTWPDAGKDVVELAGAESVLAL